MDSEIFEKYESSAQQEASSGQPPFLLELGGGGGGGERGSVCTYNLYLTHSSNINFFNKPLNEGKQTIKKS